LITGVTGQDGILLARLLRDRGDRVVGTSRSAVGAGVACYLDGVDLRPLDVTDVDAFRDLVLDVRPDTVFNLAALSSVSASWDDPETSRAVNQVAVEQMLTVLHGLGVDAPRFVQASSSEIFGPPDGDVLTDEATPLNPVSPYGEAKAAAHRAVERARGTGVSASNLVLFGHTSALQARGFALAGIAHQAAEVALGLREDLALRDPTISRDWGSAHDVARAFAGAADAEPADYVIATGRCHRLAEVAEWALAAADVTGAAVVGSPSADRPNDHGGRVGVAGRARRAFGWEPRVPLRAEIERMVRIALARLRTGVWDDASYAA
jgi:GDPmannose 4,6-dehydratase